MVGHTAALTTRLGPSTTSTGATSSGVSLTSPLTVTPPFVDCRGVSCIPRVFGTSFEAVVERLRGVRVSHRRSRKRGLRCGCSRQPGPPRSPTVPGRRCRRTATTQGQRSDEGTAADCRHRRGCVGVACREAAVGFSASATTATRGALVAGAFVDGRSAAHPRSHATHGTVSLAACAIVSRLRRRAQQRCGSPAIICPP